MLDRKIGSCDWGAAKYLAVLLKDGRFETVLGTGGKLFLLCDGDKLVSFVTLTHQDCIDDIRLFPWLGFVFTAPEYRGHRYSEQIISMLVKKPGGRDMKKYIWLRIILGSMKNTDLFI